MTKAGAPRPSDEQLMAAVRDGDVRRLGELFDRHVERLLDFFAGRGRLAPEREDLVQETFLRVIRYRKSWRGEGTFAGWLFRLAENLARDRASRAAAREPEAAERPDAREAAAPASAAPDASAATAESAARLRAALARLPSAERELLELKWFEGLDAAAIGARLRCSMGAVRVRLHRAHARLRELHRSTDRPGPRPSAASESGASHEV